MNKLVIRQGDQLPYAFPVYFRNGLIRENEIEDIEVSIGTFLYKTYKNGGVTFDSTLNFFIIYLSQEDTFSLLPSRTERGKYFEYPMLIRVKLKNSMGTQNYIYSVQGPNVEVLESLSKERL